MKIFRPIALENASHYSQTLFPNVPLLKVMVLDGKPEIANQLAWRMCRYFPADLWPAVRHHMAQSFEPRYRAWADGPEGKTDEWDEFEDAWATASAALGTTVSVSAQPDVADARYGRPARLKFVRTGRLDRALTANWTTSPGAEAARAGRDFTVRNANGTQVVFPVGQAELVVELVPREGKPHESRVTAVTIAPGEGYAPGEIPSASVVVYDPPPPTSAAPAK